MASDSTNILNDIETASPEQLGELLKRTNRDSFLNYKWDIIAVKASYSDIIYKINSELCKLSEYLQYGHDYMNIHECDTNETWTLDVRHAYANLNLAKDFFINPPIVENPNGEELKIDTTKIDWNKPVYTRNEIKSLLQISDSTLTRWLNDGWIPHTQINGSDKIYVSQEDLKEFLHNPQIFYPSSR